MPKGDGSFQYDYPAMWSGYEEMTNINKNITSGAEEMHQVASKVLAAASGATQAGYEAKFKELQTLLTDLNDMMGGKANTMQELFQNMEQLDGKLGDGF